MSKIEETLKLHTSYFSQKYKAYPWTDPNFYALYLHQVYEYAKLSTKLLAYAATRTPEKRRNFFDEIMHHIKEESGHEILAQNDLMNLKVDHKSLKTVHATKSMYEAQFGKILLYGDHIMMGYQIALEYLAITVGSELYDLLHNVYDDNSLSFLKVHVKEDVDHVEKGLESLKAFNDEELEDIADNIKQSLYAYLLIIDECHQLYLANKEEVKNTLLY
ncbi:iron-containing redox enzyme family protein [Flammeovirga agarivorans]|uniref:Iron-containing redox enzyme family protein n=1 Tax=Flammeovirga agarivorans TaxID=2726742 RepID=A0A7X8SNF2_9BACT|nr:iron-containing redox enzyme family protein [Flammeovirga agarivorans]NLR93337.1 iron-containing redox enzyme family protein [Flammeovirga agarivorans]